MPDDKPTPASVPAVNDPAIGMALSDEQMSALGVLYEDISDVFRLTQRSATLIIMHSLKISHADAARIMEHWWFGCRRKYKAFPENK